MFIFIIFLKTVIFLKIFIFLLMCFAVPTNLFWVITSGDLHLINQVVWWGGWPVDKNDHLGYVQPIVINWLTFSFDSNYEDRLSQFFSWRHMVNSSNPWIFVGSAEMLISQGFFGFKNKTKLNMILFMFCQWSSLEHSGALVHEPEVRVGQPHRVWLLEAVIFGTGLEAVKKIQSIWYKLLMGSN